MRTRNQAKRSKEIEPSANPSAPSTSAAKSQDEKGSLAEISKEAVGRLLDRANSRRGRKERRPAKDTVEISIRENVEGMTEHAKDFGLKGCTSGNAEKSTVIRSGDGEGRVICDANEMDWEEGSISLPEFKEMTVEFTDSPSSIEKKRPRKVSAEEKELAEAVHKVHLLCLVARGRLVDNACNDPLIQASILSLLPSYLLKITETPSIKAYMLGSLVRWFSENFRVHSQNIDKGSFRSNLAYALETRQGTAEEVTALSVTLFRALNLRTRYVSILDVASLKPDAEMSGTSTSDAPRLDTRICSSTTATACTLNSFASSDTTKEHSTHESPVHKLSKKDNSSSFKKNLTKDVDNANQSSDEMRGAVEIKPCHKHPNACPTKSSNAPKRKGDLEFELQMEMALSATATGTHDSKLGSDRHDLPGSLSSAPPSKKLKKSESAVSEDSCSGAVWSRKNGAPLCWAEVYCNSESLNGRWVHIDAANMVVDGEDKVEAAAAACRKPLKYVVAFAGNGAKDVTRRYCVQWYKIAPRRVNSDWWDAVMAPLKELESRATDGIIHMETPQQTTESSLDEKGSEVRHHPSRNLNISSGTKNRDTDLAGKPINEASDNGMPLDSELTRQFTTFSSGISLEDAELETRALTEPLPTNQLGYKNHHLYALERWLTKYQILHPKGPILGYCSGHPVYPQSCVQMLLTKHRWLREGFQVKANELPAKVVKHSKKTANIRISESKDHGQDHGETTLELYGKWQLEPLQLPHAKNGIVPKNEWGRVDAWSEKCLPLGTVHLRFPRLVAVARRLSIDFAPAMVGFEFRNGRSYPVYEGIVVCSEFKDAIMEAYEEEEERRESDERKKNEAQALHRWFQLLSSIITRQRLQNSYADPALHTLQAPSSCQQEDNKHNSLEGDKHSLPKESAGRVSQNEKSVQPYSSDHHEHAFLLEDQSFDEESMVRTKRCQCGFSIQVEEL